MTASSILVRISSPSHLRRAWLSVLRNDLADGALSRAGDSFAARATTEIASISEALMTGAYEPSALWTVDIPKEAGGSRHLSIPAVRDRVVERAVVDAIGPLLDAELSPWSFGYRPGSGVSDALRALIECRTDGARWVVRADVDDCFDSLSHEQLLAELSKRIDAPDLLELVRRLLARGARGARPERTNRVGAPQGGPLSPLLCNLYLHRLDMRMLANGFHCVRYADDLVVPTSDSAGARRALALLHTICSDLELELGDDKTEICSFEEGFVFLGEDVNLAYPDDDQVSPLRAPERKTLMVAKEGSVVRVSKGSMIVSEDDNDLLTVPVSHVGAITLFGAVGLSAGARQHALVNDVHVTFLSRRGSLMGSLRPSATSDATLWRASSV